MDVEQALGKIRVRKNRWNRKPRSQGTMRVYRSILNRFKDMPGEDDTKKVARFLQTLGENDSYKRTCYYALKSAFRAMGLSWFKEEEDPLPPPSENVERPWYTKSEIESIMEAAKPSLRDYLIIRITFLSGARRIQICSCKLTDYDKRSGMLNIPGAKNTPKGEWPCDQTTKPLLEKWISLQSNPSGYLFPSRNGQTKMMDPGTITRIFRRYCDEAGVTYKEPGTKRGKGAHGARRGRVTYLKKMGYDVDDITKALRWKCVYYPNKKKVLTSEGWKWMSDVKIGDLVMTHLGRFRRVLDVTDGRDSEVIMVKFRCVRQTIQVTPNHPFLVNGQWVEAQYLKIGDAVSCLAGSNCLHCGKPIAMTLYHKQWEHCSLLCRSRDPMNHLNSSPKFYDSIERQLQSKPPSFPEKLVLMMLKALGHEPVYNFRVRIESGRSYFIDWAFPMIKAGIEVHGAWYGKEKERKLARRKIRNEVLSSLGWFIIDIEFNDILSDPLGVYAKLRNELSATLRVRNEQHLYQYDNDRVKVRLIRRRKTVFDVPARISKKPIRHTKTFWWRGLTVEEDESYIVDGFVSHNSPFTVHTYLRTLPSEINQDIARRDPFYLNKDEITVSPSEAEAEESGTAIDR
jgi:integrase/very-short-patch-repair endonuclease